MTTIAQTSSRISRSVTGITPPDISQFVSSEDIPLPYMRSALVTFNAKGLKPNTQVYPFFDGQLVSQHCRLTTSNIFGSELITNSLGEISGVFRVPAETFKTGTRLFILINHPTDPSADTDCVGVATFNSYGAITYDSGRIASTRAPNITFARATSPREISVERLTTVNPSSTNFKDPIAQTFFVSGNPNGIFTTKIDVYFKSKPSDPNIPITLQIRDTVNGNPGNVILPFSSVTLYPKDVNVSTDASAPTQFTFVSPVHLKNNEEYALVLLPAGLREGYEVWTAEVGQNKLGTQEKIDKQPNAGRLYISSNSVNWTVSETRDLKFSLYKATFNVSNGSLYLKNKKIDFLGISDSSDVIEVGDIIISSTGVGVVRSLDFTRNIAQTEITSGTFSNGQSISVGKVVQGTISSSTLSTTVTGSNTSFTNDINTSDVLIRSNNTVIGTVSSITNNSTLILSANSAYEISNGTIYVREKTATISLEPYHTGVQGKLLHELAHGISFIEFNESSVSFEHKIWDSEGNEPVDYTPVSKQGKFRLGEEKTAYSYSFERLAAISGGLGITDAEDGTVMIKANLATTNNNISPVIDISKSSLVGYENIIRSVRRTLNGTISITTPSTTVTGTNTAFINQVIPGSVLRASNGRVIGIVKSLTSSTSLQLEETPLDDFSNEIVTVDYEATNVKGNSKYHTKYVTLPAGQEADDLWVFLDADIPNSTEIRVYGRFIAPGDASNIDERPWTLMDYSLNKNTLGAGEHIFKLSKNSFDFATKVGGLDNSGVFTYAKDGSLFKQFKTFAVKIVLLSTDSYYTPTVYSMRALALMA